MYFSLVRICLMLLSCHLAFPAPFRIQRGIRSREHVDHIRIITG